MDSACRSIYAQLCGSVLQDSPERVGRSPWRKDNHSGNPAYLSAAIGGAKAAGQAAAVGKVDMVGRQMIKNPSQISGLFRSLMSEVQSTFSGIARGGDAAEQLPQTPQQPESEPGLF